MTIKQQGGIFGRNPSFNDVSVESLNVTSDISANNVDVTSNISAEDMNLEKTSAGAIAEALTIQNLNSSANTEAAIFLAPTTATGNIRGARISAINDGNNAIGLKFYTGNGPTINSKLEIDATLQGNVTVNTGNLVIGTSGQGIDFSATSGTGLSELLDDYEEGLWSPTVNSGTCDVVYGSYIKIGKMVHATFKIQNLSDSTTASAINVSLPFTAGSFGASEWLGSWSIRRYDVSTSVSGAMRVLGNGTTMDFRYSDSTVGSEPKSVNYNDNTSGTNEYLAGSITYFAAS
jgi:hypothetical protein